MLVDRVGLGHQEEEGVGLVWEETGECLGELGVVCCRELGQSCLLKAQELGSVFQIEASIFQLVGEAGRGCDQNLIEIHPAID